MALGPFTLTKRQDSIIARLTIPRACLWTALLLILLVVVTILVNASDFVAIQRSSERAQLGSDKKKYGEESGEDDPIMKHDELKDLLLGKKGERDENLTDVPDEKNIAATPWTPQQNGSLVYPLSSLRATTNSSVLADGGFVANQLRVASSQPITQPVLTTKPLVSRIENTSSSSSSSLLQKTTPSLLPINNNGAYLINGTFAADAFRPRGSAKPAHHHHSATISTVSRSAATTTCRRRCHHYNNKLFLSSTDEAGIKNRMYVLLTTLQLAGYLCAQLYVSRPKFWLDTNGHNHGQQVDIRLTWSDFVTSRFVDDDDNKHDINSTSAALVDWVNHDDLNAPPLVNATIIMQSHLYKKWLTTENFFDIVSHLEQIEAFSFSQDQPQQQQQQEEEEPGSTTQQQYFIWEIQPNFYLWSYLLIEHMQQRHYSSIIPPHLLNSNSSFNYVAWRSDMQPYGRNAQNRTCIYATMGIPKVMEEMARNIFDQISQNAASTMALKEQQPPKDSHNKSLEYNNNTTVSPPRPWIGYFHVRRGDAIADCNTTLERIEQYLNCSLGEPLSELAYRRRTLHSEQQQRRRRHVIILFSSDERNIEYRKGLARLVEQQESYDLMVNTTFVVTSVDLDELGRNVIFEFVQLGRIPAWQLDNMYLFRLITYIGWGRSEVDFRLERRRLLWCPDCSKITHQFEVNDF